MRAPRFLFTNTRLTGYETLAIVEPKDLTYFLAKSVKKYAKNEASVVIGFCTMQKKMADIALTKCQTLSFSKHCDREIDPKSKFDFSYNDKPLIECQMLSVAQKN